MGMQFLSRATLVTPTAHIFEDSSHLSIYPLLRSQSQITSLIPTKSLKPWKVTVDDLKSLIQVIPGYLSSSEVQLEMIFLFCHNFL